jgi:hypothetical protein
MTTPYVSHSRRDDLLAWLASEKSKRICSRQLLTHAKRSDLERLGRFYGLRFDSSWSQARLARLVYWRINRGRPEFPLNLAA